jgi:predicted transcriptional regulator
MANANAIQTLTAGIVASYVAANLIAPVELPDLIRSVYDALNGGTKASAVTATVKRTAAQIRKSITPDHLISFENGRRYRLLRRHLSSLDLTPAAYREKWGLSENYPVVAPSYSAARSEISKNIQRGQKIRRAKNAIAAPPPKGGRKKSAK